MTRRTATLIAFALVCVSVSRWRNGDARHLNVDVRALDEDGPIGRKIPVLRGARAAEQVRVPALAKFEEELRRRVSTVVITVVDTRDRPVPGARVEVVSMHRYDNGMSVSVHREVLGVSGRDGQLRVARELLTDLAPIDGKACSLHVHVSPPHDRPDLFDGKAAAWDSTDIVLHLSAANFVRGRVVAPSGVLVSDAKVFAVLGDGANDAAHFGARAVPVSADGIFLCRFRKAGNVLLEACLGPTAPNRHPHESEDDNQLCRRGNPVRVPTGTDELTITIDPGVTMTVQVDVTMAARQPVIVRVRAEVASRISARESDRTHDWWVYHAAVPADGRVQFTHLNPDRTYVAWASCADPLLASVVEGISPTSTVLQLESTPGAAVRGRVESVPGAFTATVIARSGDLLQSVMVAENGTFAFDGLSTNRRWTFEASACRNNESDVRDDARMDLVPGETHTITLHLHP